MSAPIRGTDHGASKKRVLVAGATGYLGGFVARELANRGHFVRALAPRPEKLDSIRDGLDEVVEAEVTRPETVERVCERMDVVFSSVGITRRRDGLSFFDVDHPATGRKKAQGIECLGPRANLHLIQEDLGSRKLAEVLDAVDSWDRTAPSIVVAEGLVQYLPPAAVRDLFSQCGAVTGPDSRMVFTYVGCGDDGRPHIGRWTGLTLWLLEKSGEPWLWSIRPEELAGFLAETGWTHAPQLMSGSGTCGRENLAVAVKAPGVA